MLASLALVASACGSDSDSSSSTDAPADSAAPAGTDASAGTEAPAGTDPADAPAAASGDVCVEGDSVQLGFLNSTSGPMAISEQTVRDALLLGAEEINAAGGILGKQIEFIEEDGQSEPTIFAEKINKLLTEDNVAAVFGGWTSASRKAMLPVVEGANGLLFYPVQYEGLEASPNIYYT
ncbi:MAG: transporter substrate-binding protein, partial [Ilumatobacteraceae bacterium]